MDYKQSKFYGDDDTDYSILFSAEFDPEYLYGENFDINEPEYMGAWITAALAALRGAGKGIRAIGRAVRRRRGRGGRRRARRVGRIARKIFKRIKARRARRKAAGRGLFRKIRGRIRARRKKRGYVRKSKLFRRLRARRLARRARRKARKTGTPVPAKKRRVSKLRQRIRARRAARRARRGDSERIRPFKIMADNVAQSYRDSVNPNNEYAARDTRRDYPVHPLEQTALQPQFKTAGFMNKNMMIMAAAGAGLFILSQVMKPKTVTYTQRTP